jgi:hypothetical protein
MNATAWYRSLLGLLAATVLCVNHGHTGELLSAKSLAELRNDISSATEDAWEVTLEEHAIVFTFKQTFNGLKRNRYPSGPLHTWEPLNYQFKLTKADYVIPKEHDKKKQETNQAVKIAEEKVFTSVKHTRQPKSMKPTIPFYSFYPENSKQKQLLKRYEHLKSRLRYWPDVHYRANGFCYFRLNDYKAKTPKDGVIYKEALNSKKQVFNIIKWYKPSRMKVHTQEHNQQMHQD